MAATGRPAPPPLTSRRREETERIPPLPEDRVRNNDASRSEKSFRAIATRVPDCWIPFAELTGYDAQACFWGTYWHYLLVVGIAANAPPLAQRGSSTADGPTAMTTTHFREQNSALLDCVFDCLLVLPCVAGCFIGRLPSETDVQAYIIGHWENPETVGDRSKARRPRPFVAAGVQHGIIGMWALLCSIAVTTEVWTLYSISMLAATLWIFLVLCWVTLRYIPALVFAAAYPCFLYIFFVVRHSSWSDVLAVRVSLTWMLKAVFQSPFVRSAAFIYVAMHIWTAIFDSVRVDDETAVARAGRRNARRRLNREEMTLAIMVESIALAIAGKEVDLSGIWFVWGCGGACLVQAVMLARVELDDRHSCEWWFRKASVLSGWCLVTGVIACYISSFVLPAFDRALTLGQYLNLAMATARGINKR